MPSAMRWYGRAATRPVRPAWAAGFIFVAVTAGWSLPAAAAETAAWPDPRAGLVAVFQARPAPGAELAVLDDSGKTTEGIKLAAHGLARLDRFGALLAGSGFFTTSLAEPGLARLRKADAFSLELWLTAAAAEDKTRGVILQLGSPQAPLLTLRQEGAELVLARAAAGGQDQGLCRVEAGQAGQLLLSFNSKNLLVYRNGRLIKTVAGAALPGKWTDGGVSIGAAGDGASGWSGRVAGLALGVRGVSADEALRNYEAGPGAASAPSAGAVRPLRLRGKLLRRSDAPTFEQINPYPRAVAVYEYAVESVTAGAYNRPKILVAHWTLLDRQVLPIAELPAGLSYELEVEPYAAQAQLTGQFRSETLDADPELDLYFDAAPPSRVMPQPLAALTEFREGARVNGFATFVGGKGFVEQAYFRTHRGEPTTAYYICSGNGDFTNWFEWETAPAPAKLPARVTLALEVVMAGYYNNDGGRVKFAGRDGPFPFDLLLNGKPLLRLDTVLKGDTGWTVGRREDPLHVKAFFDLLGTDQFWDNYGILYLDVPAALLQPGRPARLKVETVVAEESAFFGVIKTATNTWECADKWPTNPAQVRPSPEVAKLIQDMEDQRVAGRGAHPIEDLAGKLLKLTGGHGVRLVWARNTTSRGRRSGDGTTSEYILMGFDTDEKTERVILPGPACYGRPFFVDGGRRIVFTDFDAETIRIVDWDGRNERVLCDGFAHCLWRDPSNGAEWIFCSSKTNKVSRIRGFKSIERFRLDKPAAWEKVWDKIPMDLRLSVSADGTRLGSAFPWPDCGIVIPSQGVFQKRGNGCNSCISPDNEYRFFFMNNEHTDLLLYGGNGKMLATIPINQMPGINGREMWFSRWSNRPEFLTICGPGIGSSEANVYVGKFSPDFKKVEEWLQVTADDRHETAANCWIKP